MTQPILITCAFLLTFTIVIMMFLEVFEIAPISTGFDWATLSQLNVERNTLNVSEMMKNMPAKKTFKWIVVTSIQSPTEDVKRLASYPDWTLVVVGDTKTPADWSLSDVHYLSIEFQEAMGFASVNRLPTKSYTRKNAGYLYAIANGAHWIYDTDDDNKPYGKGLDQFEFATDRMRGVRFNNWENGTLQESLFNPYRHFGRPDMWPRGFPLEHIKKHDHHDGCYSLCRVQRPPVVQQGIVQKDPDVDAIYRLLHAQPESGLDESFNEFAPPIILAPVAFRVTDIWRSYFTQALLHIAGETVSFVPVNAIQKRNAHSYLKDFDDEIDVYDKAGEIVQFINQWKCIGETMDKCTIELAERFAEQGFWGQEDAQLVIHWVMDLQKIGYTFPAKRADLPPDYTIGEDKDLTRNCRRVHLTFTKDLPKNTTQPAEKRAAAKIYNFGDLKDWCDASNSSASQHWYFPTPEQLAAATLENKTLIDNYQTVAIITNNWQWSMGMGMLQRMYDANFAMLIFCGHYPKQSRYADLVDFPEGMADGDSTYPNLKRPINYIDLSNEEVRWGYLMYYCIAKVEEMKIQNVKGYVMFSDDVLFNFWNPLNLDILQGTKRAAGWGQWWPNKQFGFDSMNKTIQLITGKYKADWEVTNFVADLTREVARKPRIEIVDNTTVTDPLKYLMVGDGWVIGDWMYVPTSNISFVAMFAQLAHEGELFHELFTSKIMHILPSEGSTEADPTRVRFLWGTERTNWTEKYEASQHGLHPAKLTEFLKFPERAKFCDAVLDKFYHNIFRIGNWT
ncbi:hypothetical protein PRIPAC_70071 [Pristionchus pacificus]|uniref:Uncharacterized protein n=1 Tax=Pristionchus pacificus TaxID=54126 RepID=A0A2A6CS76_PRIPA|nr:hypothetical protein PRIPAC_70071 [Pristionchus pacificus]|eukprot:PDM80970.1 hypothetical protein PRIPAC_35973 [Pristionchus pacificus]